MSSEIADTIAEAVTRVPGVASLHAGMFGEVGTYLPGRRVVGVRVTESSTDIHVCIFVDAAVRDTALRIREAVSGLVAGPVNVTVEDVVGRAHDA
ncbi:hypothetical protein ACIQYW_08015 [Rhodococcus erythropolis]|uniref:hypothetical protein n=1 Tax=Rhodococcus erythropolis group TaxID=2840174 RepID=UPI001F407BE7|nr:hypothetical protein [Rhodococcus erythropolis]UJC77308.1 hypothetical protein D4768_06190 [Rhodococcus erythropolis]